MPSKKIIDDYYLQLDSKPKEDEETARKKVKLQVKGKIRLKKSSQEKDKSPVETQGDVIEQKDAFQEILKNLQETSKKNLAEKKDLSVQSFAEKEAVADRGSFSSEELDELPKKQINNFQKSKPNVRRNNKEVNEVKDIRGSFEKKLGQKTLSNFSKGIDKGGFEKGNLKKDDKFFTGKKKHQSKQKFEIERYDEERGKTSFKKDKTSKYSKNVLLDEEDLYFSRSSKIRHTKKQEKKVEDIVQSLIDRSGETVVVPSVLSVKELSEKIGVPIAKLIAEFMRNGMKVNLNSKIDYETASIVAETFNVKLKKDISSGFGVEDILTGDISSLLAEEDSSLLVERPPVVSVMGHVDHGKTSLLDHIRKTKVVDKEAGGITQSIGAYQVEYNGKKITFIDTPGHEAFTMMRARGAKSTDIAILVVAADEGVKSQTIESINHAREANLQIIVAITKIDKEQANIENVKSGLASIGLIPEDWGGDIPMIGVSSKTGVGISELLELILVYSEILGLKANPLRPAVGTVLESHLDAKIGPVSTILINTGTLREGDAVVCKGSYGRVKVMKNDNLKNIDEAGPGTPVLVVGFDNVLEGGDVIQVVSDIEKARIRALEYKELIASKKAISDSSIDSIMSKIKSGNLKQLKMVVKADANGSLEAIKGALLKLSTEDIKVTIIHYGVGNVTEGDVLMCQGSSALLIGFNVDLLGNAKNIIKDSKVEYISSNIIYHITEKVKKIISGMFDSKEVEVPLGEAVLGGIFFRGDGFMILGLRLKPESRIEKDSSVRIIRGNKLIGGGKIENLKSGMIDVNSLEGPTECGIKLKTDVKVEMGDILEIYKVEMQK